MLVFVGYLSKVYQDSFFINARIWESCCGPSQNLVKALQKYGCTNIIKSDLKPYEGVDFQFDMTSEEKDPCDFDMIITNPPYKSKRKILERCFMSGKPFALLLPFSILGTKYGKNLFIEHRGTVMVPISKKVSFAKDKKKVQVGDVAWFIGNLPESIESLHPIVLEFAERTDASKDSFLTEDEAFETENEDEEEA